MTYSELRASDAERERVVTFLREHALLGRLSDDELEDRIGTAYAAVTVGDLERLIADLPRAGHPARRPQRPARPPRPRRPAHRRNVPPAAIAACVVAFFIVGGPAIVLGGAALVVVLAVALLATVLALSFAFGPFILIGLLIARVARRRHSSPMRWGPTPY